MAVALQTLLTSHLCLDAAQVALSSSTQVCHFSMTTGLLVVPLCLFLATLSISQGHQTQLNMWQETNAAKQHPQALQMSERLTHSIAILNRWALKLPLLRPLTMLSAGMAHDM